MPNPSGANQFANQPAYGDVSKLTRLTQAAPMSGAPTPAPGNVPKRAQRAAAHGRQAPTAPAPAASGQPAATASPSYRAQLGVIWNQILQHAPEDPLVQHYAQVSQK